MADSGGVTPLTPNPGVRSNTQPDGSRANHNGGHSNRAGRDIWEPIAAHLAITSGIMLRCKASAEATVCVGRHLSVRCNRPVTDLPAACACAPTHSKSAVLRQR